MHFISQRDPVSNSSGLSETCAEQRVVPVLPDGDLKALGAINTKETFTLGNLANMYTGIKKLRPKK